MKLLYIHVDLGDLFLPIGWRFGDRDLGLKLRLRLRIETGTAIDNLGQGEELGIGNLEDNSEGIRDSEMDLKPERSCEICDGERNSTICVSRC